MIKLGQRGDIGEYGDIGEAGPAGRDGAPAPHGLRGERTTAIVFKSYKDKQIFFPIDRWERGYGLARTIWTSRYQR